MAEGTQGRESGDGAHLRTPARPINRSPARARTYVRTYVRAHARTHLTLRAGHAESGPAEFHADAHVRTRILSSLAPSRCARFLPFLPAAPIRTMRVVRIHSGHFPTERGHSRVSTRSLCLFLLSLDSPLFHDDVARACRETRREMLPQENVVIRAAASEPTIAKFRQGRGSNVCLGPRSSSLRSTGPSFSTTGPPPPLPLPLPLPSAPLAADSRTAASTPAVPVHSTRAASTAFRSPFCSSAGRHTTYRMIRTYDLGDLDTNTM